MPSFSRRRTQRMYPGRLSIPHARYFITVRCNHGNVLRDRHPALFETFHEFESSGDVQNDCATVMPDHVHWIFKLGERLRLGQVVGKWKVRSQHSMDEPTGFWQRDYYEHRLRPNEAIEAYTRYVFMNPYRAGLVGLHETWPGTRLWNTAVQDFTRHLIDGRLPPPEWPRLNSPMEPGD